MSKLVWDKIGDRSYETGVSQVVLYPQTAGAYPKGVAWSGVTSISQSPSGAEPNPMYADNIKYLNLLSAEDFGATIEAYTCPDEFAECDGYAEIGTGVKIGQQPRTPFGLCYKTIVGNDTEQNKHGYKLHIIYGALAAPSEKQYQTVSDSPELTTMSWELSTTPVAVAGCEPTAYLEIDSRTVDSTKLEAFEKIIYGTDESGSGGKEARLPLPDEIKTLLAGE